MLDIKQWRLWSAPFLVFGANSIAFFMFAGVVGRLVLMFNIGEVSIKNWIYIHIFQPWLGDLNASLAYAISFLLLSYMVMFVMYHKQILWKVCSTFYCDIFKRCSVLDSTVLGSIV